MLKTITWLMSLHPDGGRRPHPEDAIFGSIVGVLSYVDIEMQRVMLKVLLPPKLAAKMNSLKDISVSQIDCWRTVPGEDGSWIIPDAIIDLDGPKEKYRLVVEAKWDSKFSDAQVEKQRQYIRSFELSKIDTKSHAEKRTQVHLLLVRDSLGAEKHIENISPDREEIFIRTWDEVLSALKALRTEQDNDRISRWAQDAIGALKVLGAKTFEGFSPSKLPYPNLAVRPIVFFHRQFNWMPAFDRLTSSPIFWRN